MQRGSYDKGRITTDDQIPMDARSVLILTLPVIFVLLFLLDKSSKIGFGGRVDAGGELRKLRKVGPKADVMRVLRELQASQVFFSLLISTADAGSYIYIYI